ncbi:TonB-dependent receptor plug domain-containing protein [Methylocystis parvus]|uniref:TonB-dependent receptor plug domain-containing protein n=1 Tax=Methylocystis parvus TaxID=134 RepID=UPI003C70D01A
MTACRAALICAVAVLLGDGAVAETLIRREKSHPHRMSLPTELASNSSYMVPYVTGPTGAKYSIMELPGSATVVSRQVIEDQRATTLGQALRNVSGVTVRGR